MAAQLRFPLPRLDMSYFPLLTAPGCAGWTTVFNFAPNNWEEGSRVARFLNVSWTDGTCWQTRQLGRLEYGELQKVEAADLASVVPAGCLPLLSLTDEPPSAQRNKLSVADMPRTSYPNWRATLGLQAVSGARTCYQGEVDPFPAPGSLLTFGYFLQFGPGVENHLLLLNVEASPLPRSGILEVRDAAQPGILKASHEVSNNSVNIIPLGGDCVDESNLPLLVCREMSGIPLYFSCSADGRYLSLEHTHPPASSVLHGRRWEAQKLLKQIWFSKAEQA